MQRPSSAVLLLLLCFAWAQGCHSANVHSQHRDFSNSDQSWFRTELVYGMLRPTGEPIREDEWQAYLNEEVTPRFPNGFTVLEGYGQYRLSSGQLIRESCRIILVVHSGSGDSSTALEELRAVYKSRFQQESIIRITSPAIVSF